MKRIPSLFLAASSLFSLAAVAYAATRPHYGETLVMETSARIASLDPAKLPVDPASRALAERILFLIGDRLVRLDDRGNASPSLAAKIIGNGQNQDWSFPLEANVKFSDGHPLTAGQVIKSLSAVHTDWQISAAQDGVRIVLPQPAPEFLLTLGLAENSILRKDERGLPVGTGPFQITEFSASEIDLAATENGWRSRPYLDKVRVLMGRTHRDQWIDFQLGRADLVELSPSEERRARENKTRLWCASPEEVVALVFQRSSAAAQEFRVRQALAAAVNRVALHDVLLQKLGEETTMLLPEWLSGFPELAGANSSPAKTTPTGSSGPFPPLTLSYESSDSLLRSFAGRIAVDARAAGLVLRLRPQLAEEQPVGDIRLVRERISSLDPARALMQMIADLNLSGVIPVPVDDSPTGFYDAERSLGDTDWAIPLVDPPDCYAVGTRVRQWDPSAVLLSGGWRLENVWKEPD